MSADWYHCQLKPISRSSGRSAVACAAYRTGTTLEDERYDAVRDFSRKSDVVTHFTLARDGAPDWASDVAQLWNRVEDKESRKNSTLAFEWEVALPNELDDAQREAVARTFGRWLVTEYGTAVTIGIHSGGARGNGLNDHMHGMMTTRALNDAGWEAKKLRVFNTAPGARNPEVERVREYVAGIINAALDEAGFDDTHHVTHLSFAARGIDKTATVHLGPGATGFERRGVETGRGDINRAILEERLAWQQHQAMPEITAELERELAARFGDEPRSGLSVEPERHDLAPEPPPVSEALTAEPAPAAEPGALRRLLPWGTAWRAFADRARALAARVAALWADESGAPPREPAGDAAEPGPGQDAAPEPPAGALWQRLVTAERTVADAARSIWSNERGSVPADGDLAGALFAAYQADEPDGAAPLSADIPPDDTPAPGEPRPPEPDPREPDGPDFG